MKKVSEITIEDIANYLRLAEIDDADKKQIELYLDIAKNYISNYTGIKITSDNKEEETLDDYSDFIIVIFILCNDMYDNRSYYVDNKNLNKVVETILNMHTRNNI